MIQRSTPGKRPGGAVRPPRGGRASGKRAYMLGANGFLIILARSLFYHILPGNERGQKKVYKFPWRAAGRFPGRTEKDPRRGAFSYYKQLLPARGTA